MCHPAWAKARIAAQRRSTGSERETATTADDRSYDGFTEDERDATEERVAALLKQAAG